MSELSRHFESALEAKDRRIAELELAAKWEGDLAQQALDDLKKRDARIAELEAENAKLRTALKPFADKADKAEGPFETPYPADYPLWRAARAALGEKE